MGKKLSYNYVKKEFEKRGYTLLSKEYINANVKLKYKCSEGHTHEILWKHFNNGHGCLYCAGVAKPTIEEIRKTFLADGYVLLSTKYVNNATKLKYRCNNGHVHSITWSSFKNEVRCPYCANNGIPSITEIETAFLMEGYTLRTRSYKNAHEKLESVCPFGHIHYTTWNAFQQGKRCKECYDLSRFGSGNPSWQGGKSFEPYCPVWSDKGYKADIRERDSNICQNPYCYKTTSRLHIHHIDYNKKNCHPNNLITVCGACNSRANIDRDWHTEWYRTIMHKKFGYIY